MSWDDLSAAVAVEFVEAARTGREHLISGWLMAGDEDAPSLRVNWRGAWVRDERLGFNAQRGLYLAGHRKTPVLSNEERKRRHREAQRRYQRTRRAQLSAEERAAMYAQHAAYKRAKRKAGK